MTGRMVDEDACAFRAIVRYRMGQASNAQNAAELIDWLGALGLNAQEGK